MHFGIIWFTNFPAIETNVVSENRVWIWRVDECKKLVFDPSRAGQAKLRQTTWFGFLTGLCAIFALLRLRFSFSLRSVKSRTSSRFSRLKQTVSFSFSFSFSYSFSFFFLLSSFDDLSQIKTGRKIPAGLLRTIICKSVKALHFPGIT